MTYFHVVLLSISHCSGSLTKTDVKLLELVFEYQGHQYSIASHGNLSGSTKLTALVSFLVTVIKKNTLITEL